MHLSACFLFEDNVDELRRVVDVLISINVYCDGGHHSRMISPSPTCDTLHRLTIDCFI